MGENSCYERSIEMIHPGHCACSYMFAEQEIVHEKKSLIPDAPGHNYVNDFYKRSRR